MIGLEFNLTTPQPIRCKTKTNHDMVIPIFPHLKPVTCVYFEFSLAPSDSDHVPIGGCDYFQLVLVYITQLKSASDCPNDKGHC